MCLLQICWVCVYVSIIICHQSFDVSSLGPAIARVHVQLQDAGALEDRLQLLAGARRNSYEEFTRLDETRLAQNSLNYLNIT